MQKVAAYCRVSTDKSDQVNSLDNQKKYFEEYINRNPNWELVEIYCDEGITGTSTKKRHAFNRMIEDACNRKFDLIVTKEISRFARNTLDSIFFTRKLKDAGVGVLFMNDNINTLDADAELRLTIMSSIAQEESRKTSERVKWGQKRRMEQGVVFGRDLLGYDVRDGKLFINPTGAETVKLIFYKFVYEGKGSHTIARELSEVNTQKTAYIKNWSNTTILRILRNEKYCGDLVQKKTLTPSYLNHEKKYNHGQEEFVVLRNHHEPIISRELFEKAQQELSKRSPSDTQKAKYSNRYCFSGKIKCGVCGASYVTRIKKRKDGSINHTWHCYHAINSNNKFGCNNHTINDNDMKLILQQVVKHLPISRDKVCEQLFKILKSVLTIQGKKRNSKTDLYLQNDLCIAEIMHLANGEKWDDSFYKAFIDKIVVHSNNTIEVYIKSQFCHYSYLIFKKSFKKHHNNSSVGTEELGHMEMVSTIVYQLTRNLTMEQIKESGFDAYFVDHTTGIYPQAASGVPFSAAALQSKGDAITDINEDLAAEQKARTTYDNILRLADDPDVKDAIRFLRAREIVHYQRFGDALRVIQDNLDYKNFYAFNPEFDKR